MGLLNNNDYIDPFKGSDYIDPSSNAERLSNQVNRDHARRESYVQRRYVKPAQSDQASRDRQAPQNTRSKQDGRSQQAQGDQSTRGDTLQTMLNDWSTQTMRYAQSMQQSLQQALRQNQQNPQNPQGRPSQPYNPPRIQTERATREFQSTSDKKQRRHKNGFVTVLEIVIIIAVIASIGGMLSDSMSNIISDFDGSTSQFEELSTQETVSEDVGKLYSTGGKALEVNIEGVQTGPEDLNGDATLTVFAHLHEHRQENDVSSCRRRSDGHAKRHRACPCIHFQRGFRPHGVLRRRNETEEKLADHQQFRSYGHQFTSCGSADELFAA